MWTRVWFQALSLSLLLLSGAVNAQGIVAERGPRHPAAPAAETCETWEGDIRGNDPSARIVVELCTRGDRVRGTFLWSSSVSGWDRRALEGEWRDGASTLAARDTAMLDAHPLHGWTLCASDSYALRRVSADRLEGSYTSARCRDHGRLAINRRVPAPVPAAKVPSSRPRFTAVPTLASFRPSAHHGIARCSATPGMSTGSPSWMMVMALAGAMAFTRRRGRA